MQQVQADAQNEFQMVVQATVAAQEEELRRRREKRKKEFMEKQNQSSLASSFKSFFGYST